MFNFSISTNIVNKRVILGIKCKFFPESVINIVIIVNSWQAKIACILVAYTSGDIVLPLHRILYLVGRNIYNCINRCQNKFKILLLVIFFQL